MSAILLVTADPAVRDHLREYAARAGAYLTGHADLDTAIPQWGQADLVLLGRDLADDAAGRSLPRTGELVIVTTDLDQAHSFDMAVEVTATFVAFIPAAQRWLTDRLERASDAAARLKAAGFRVGYADRSAAQGSVSCHALTDHRYHDDDAMFVSVEDVARGECRFDQSGSVARSNYRSLRRVFPNVWTDLVYTNVTALGAFLCDLPADLVNVLIGLKEQYPLFDDADHSELEAEEVRNSWRQWVAADVHRGLGERAQAVWDALDGVERDRLWWEVVDGVGARPDHDGRTVCWDLDRLTPLFAARLMAQWRRGYRHDRRYQVVRAYRGQPAWGPKYAVLFPEQWDIIATCYSRFEGKVAIWRHQADRRAAINAEVGMAPCPAMS